MKQIHIDSEDVDDDIFQLQASVAIVDALKQNSKLVQLIITVECCTFEACVTLIDGLKLSTLKLFRFRATLGDESVQIAHNVANGKIMESFQQEICAPLAAALADAVENNSYIEFFTMEVGNMWELSDTRIKIQFDDTSNLRLSHALAKNISLMSVHFSFFEPDRNFELNEYCKRNLQMRKVCFVLAQVAKPTDAFSSLKDANVRREVFSWFLPPDSRPAHFFHVLGV